MHKVPIDKVSHLVRSFSHFQAGEASCFVLAKEKGWCVATDDGAAKAHIRKELGVLYVLTTFDILLKSVRLGVIEKKDAEKIVDEMEKMAYFTYSEEDYKNFSLELRKL